MPRDLQSAAGVTDPDEIDKLCAEGRDAAQFLTQYVVQAKLNDRGNFGRSAPFVIEDTLLYTRSRA